MKVLKHEGIFHLYDRHASIIFTDEKQLERIIDHPANPLFGDEERGFSLERRGIYDENETSLLSICKDGQERHANCLEASYDFFFGGTTRSNYPSSDTTVRCFKVIHDVAKEHGMGFGASILNPLDIGGGYVKDHEETGFTYNFKEIDIQPDGSYDCEMRFEKQWNNNKGPIHPQIHKLLCFAFNEQRIDDTPYFYVDPNAIIDISDTASIEIHEDTYKVSSYGYGVCKMNFRGKWEDPTANRALCVVVYRTPELDYFADSALNYFKEVLDQHNAAGITYDAFYSDEMHIQFDWDLREHFGPTEITTRYLTPNLAKKYASLYGEQYLDFAKYLVYMSYHQHDFLPGEEGKENAQHVFAPTEDGIYQTWLFRNRYFELLQSTVVKLCMDAKDYAESLWGGPIMTRAHATWQESPTTDHPYEFANEIGGPNVADRVPEYADVTPQSPVERRAAFEIAKGEKIKEMGVSRYDYTPWYKWSSSIRENTAACYDYFKWNDYFTGGGNDHAEGGYLDRNYLGQALASSFGSLNEYRIAYGAGWGMPKVVHNYLHAVSKAYGNEQFSRNDYNFLQDLHTRQSDVLALYPIELNNVEERFGSWMVQYGYCNYITEEKLLLNAKVLDNGTLQVRNNTYRTLLVMFEPFLAKETLSMIEQFLQAGGKVLWMSLYPVLTHEGDSLLADFNRLFGIEKIENGWHGVKAKNETITFTGSYADIAPMEIRTDFIVDFVYPFTAAADAEVIAQYKGQTVAVSKTYPSGGVAVYAGFRVRDDQSGSLGKDVDTLYQMLQKMGAYADGSLEAKSRATGAKYVMNRFANDAVTVAPHFREIYEAWEGTFFREDDFDAAVMAGRILPCTKAAFAAEGIDVPAIEDDGSKAYILLDEEINGHKIGYTGTEYLCYRFADGKLQGLSGSDTTGITVDGVEYKIANQPAKFNFGPVPAEFYTDKVEKMYMVTCYTAGTELVIPVTLSEKPIVEVCGIDIFDTVAAVPFEFDGENVKLQITEELVGKQIVIYLAK